MLFSQVPMYDMIPFYFACLYYGSEKCDSGVKRDRRKPPGGGVLPMSNT